MLSNVSAIRSCKGTGGTNKFMLYLGPLWINGSLRFGGFRSAFTLPALIGVIGEVD
jgi:hypothetical protein